ncbi:MAG: GntR family transcriptional regulator [Microgenomates group bacterium]|jgi:DNA-binding GntR family transcriptional regulator
MNEENRKIPTHEVTYTKLRDMILYGKLEPGQPVTIQGLIAELGAGMTPVREAIRRLAAEGALLPQGNRRVTVPRLTVGQLDQLAFMRLSLEPKLAEMAAASLTPQAIAKLESLDADVNRAIEQGSIPDYLQSNHAFHFALYDLAGAGLLLDITRSLWLRFGPSLRVVIAQSGGLGLPDRHLEAINAMQAADAPGLARAIERDITQGIEQVRAALDRNDI